MMPSAESFNAPEHQPFFYEGTRDAAALLVHGFPGSAKEMRPVADILHGLGMTTQGLLLPGFGPELDTITERDHREWQATVENALLDLKAQYSTVLIVGNSMGGALSMWAAARYPVDGLILFAPFWKVDMFLWNALPVIKRLFPRVRPFRVFKPDFNDPEFQKGTRNFIPDADFDDPAFREATLNLEIHTNVFDQIRAVGAAGYKAAPHIMAPALVIQGSGDDLVSPKTTRKLITRLADMTYLEVDAPHNPIQPELDAWADVAHAIKTFAVNQLPIRAESEG